MKIRLLLIILFFFSIGCASNTPRIQDYLLDRAVSEDEKDANTALFLLSDVRLYNQDFKTLKELFDKEEDPTKKLIYAYVLAKRSAEERYDNAFIDLYPTGKDQIKIWEIRQKTDFIHVTSPLQKRLGYLASTNEKALAKLLSGYDFADGADAESLHGRIYEIYKHKPKYLLRMLEKYKLKIEGINRSY